ncbi:isopenicillin N synthase family dioxygenase [Pseudofrankia inefficax]|uniref:2OG-Fe(II) oxygenase n=1 Tax=Pseudofrankia inefficax (strain DSM 45817 / CECT 9037 / DDB 130130 / EuI1c) TaxID=298654 RepID=E3J8X6_PSEI1|nr:2-oxoglutarate and iron-dependent oxygenase domain-containing protein [Pseudofrankia inefficax]ADP79709.1 2OG-Fe(II) oxygenase [Pseudofrankia inefficax]
MGSARTSHGTLDVPVIDLSGYRRGEPAAARALAAAVDDAARTVGFMQVVGHGIPAGTEAGLTAALDTFFALPMATKLASRPASTAVNRGYSPPRSERLSHSLGVYSPADLFEAFNVGIEAGEYPGLGLPASYYADNIWPAGAAGFRAGVERWFAAARQLAETLTGVFALALGLPAGYFDAFQSHSLDVLRMNNYLVPGDVTLEEGQVGMGAHTDYGIVTILWADPVPGLQILDRAGRWHDVLPAPGALLVNLGDLLARWTNDRWVSTMHRVVPPRDAGGRLVRRRSAAYFHDGDVDAVIACLPGCATPDNPARYEPVTVADHLTAKLTGSRGLVLNAAATHEAARLRPTD